MSLQPMEKAWSQFVENDDLNLQVVRTEVANSWQRCRNHKVNPFDKVDVDIKGLELKERLYQLQHLVNIARPFMENLYNFVKGSGFQVVLADKNGFLLEVMGDQEIIKKTQQIHLCAGANWSEAVKGTNAIGTALVDKTPTQIFAWEHFCQPNHFLTCSAAPIFDPEGDLIGALDITGDYKVANPHTLGMVVAAVNAIENQLQLHKATTKLYMAYKYSSAILESVTDGLISIDKNGVVTQMNSCGGKILGVNPDDTIGKHVVNIFKSPPPMIQVLSTGKGYQDREIYFEVLGKKVISSATPLRDDYGDIIGAVATIRETHEVKPMRKQLAFQARYVFDDIIGECDAIKETKDLAKRASDSPSTVLLIGESGTGKELFAQAIHNNSSVKDGPFIAINCAALPESLIESELFGYEEGAFTGSKKGGQPGKFELANGGTVFLDEIGDMPMATQVKLLRVIQEKKVSRIGAVGEIPVDIRLIAATNKNLAAEVRDGNFRGDLYYRLNVITIGIPALKDRIEDIELLTRHFVEKISAKLNKKNIYIGEDFFTRLKAYNWPGNIRELENTVERALHLVGDYGMLTSASLPFESVDSGETKSSLKEVMSLKDVEKETIVQAFKLYRGNISKISAKLGIGRNTLYRKLKEYDININ